MPDRAAFRLSGPRREGEEPKPMMHGHEKSDPEIVAIRTNAGGMRREKPANKAVLTAAELVERRAGTKGNAGQQSYRQRTTDDAGPLIIQRKNS